MAEHGQLIVYRLIVVDGIGILVQVVVRRAFLPSPIQQPMVVAMRPSITCHALPIPDERIVSQSLSQFLLAILHILLHLRIDLCQIVVVVIYIHFSDGVNSIHDILRGFRLFAFCDDGVHS